MKNALVDSLIGAAENTNNSHSSSPKFFLMLLKMIFLAILQPKGNGPPFTSAYVPKFKERKYLQGQLIWPNQQFFF